jgi:uncharacterized protein involved in response to NO
MRSGDARARIASGPPPIWPPYVLAAGLLALSGGFLLGALLLVLRAAGADGSEWQAAAVQAHGHIQIFGWGGLMVLGVGLHFLPRLVSVPLTRPAWARYALGLLVAGLVLRALAQPAMADGLPGWLRGLASVCLALAATSEIVGTTTIVFLIFSLIRGMKTAVKKRIAPSVIALIASAFASLWLGIALSSVGVLRAALDENAIVAPRLDNASILLGLLGFLVPVSLAMSARLFPLYAFTRVPRERLLGIGTVALLLGLLARLIGELARFDVLAGFGQIGQVAGILCAVIALSIFGPRRQLPRRKVRVLTDPLQLHLVTSYGWLLLSGIFIFFEGLDRLGVALWSVPLDAERHALGAGFVTLLIFGVGSEMLPGFAQAPLRLPRLRWATLVLGNLAALLRVGPLLLRIAPTGWNTAIMSSAGLLGAAAIALFLINIPWHLAIRVRPDATKRSL